MSVDQFAFNQNGTRQTITPNSNYETGDYIIVALDVDNLLVWLGHYDVSTDTTKWYNTSDNFIHQWMIELYKRFGLLFTIIDEKRCQESGLFP